MSFIGKLIGYFVNELIVKTLANSKGFQRFAVRSDNFVQAKKKVVRDVGEEVIIKAKNSSEDIIKDKGNKISDVVADKSGFNLGVFFKHLKEEMSKNAKEPPKKSKYSGGSQ